jgi:hypothetical protein
MVSNSFKQVIFGALAKKGLRSQGASAFVRHDSHKPRAEREHCGCWKVIHEKVPHPKYGDRVAHFEAKTVRDPDCEHARAEAERLLSLAPVAAPAAPVPFEMEDEDATPEYDGRCQEETKSGTRCKNGTPGRFCRVHGG